MVIDPTITAGNLIEIGVILVGGIVTIAILRGKVTDLTNDMTEMKTEMKKVGEALTTLAVTSNRLDRVEQDIWELKHGEGFVFPLNKGRAPP